MLMDDYAAILTEKINTIRTEQREKIMIAARLAAQTMLADGLIYVFGCGHSHILAEETFYRAGGLACVSPVFYEPLMLHESAAESSRLEKQAGLAAQVLSGLHLEKRDLMICISTSGVNAVPVEFAFVVKEQGIPVIGISSHAYDSQAANNPLGRHLFEVCDLCIDNAAPHGDACLTLEGLPVKMTPVSTVTGAFILNSILAEASALLLAQGKIPPVYYSGNIPGGAEGNRQTIERYKERIRFL